MSSSLLEECAPPALSPRTSSSSQRSMMSMNRIGRKHRQRKQRNVSIKFQAQNFVKNRGLGEDLDDHYDIGDKIGEGGFGEVYTAVHKKTGAERAVKVIYKTEDDDDDFETVNTTIRNEFAVVKSLDHPNLLKQYEMFEDEDKFMIVTGKYCRVWWSWVCVLTTVSIHSPPFTQHRPLSRWRTTGRIGKYWALFRR